MKLSNELKKSHATVHSIGVAELIVKPVLAIQPLEDVNHIINLPIMIETRMKRRATRPDQLIHN